MKKLRWAQVGLTIGGTPIQTPNSVSHITPTKAGFLGGNLIQLAIQLTLLAAVLLCLLFLIWGGIDWILSAGDPKAVEGARRKILYAVIGLAITFLSFFIVMAVGNFFNIQLFAPTTTVNTPGGPI